MGDVAGKQMGNSFSYLFSAKDFISTSFAQAETEFYCCTGMLGETEQNARRRVEFFFASDLLQFPLFSSTFFASMPILRPLALIASGCNLHAMAFVISLSGNATTPKRLDIDKTRRVPADIFMDSIFFCPPFFSCVFYFSMFSFAYSSRLQTLASNTPIYLLIFCDQQARKKERQG